MSAVRTAYEVFQMRHPGFHGRIDIVREDGEFRAIPHTTGVKCGFCSVPDLKVQLRKELETSFGKRMFISWQELMDVLDVL